MPDTIANNLSATLRMRLQLEFEAPDGHYAYGEETEGWHGSYLITSASAL